MHIYDKLDKARESVRSTSRQKTTSGGKFKYFTPEEVEAIVAEVCTEQRILPVCNLKRNEHGLFQEMTLVNLDDLKDTIVFTLATHVGAVMNANDTQNMGSTDTYSERYIKMKVFQIKDNNLDPDGQQGGQSQPVTNDGLDDM
jgi:hypothetical protein